MLTFAVIAGFLMAETVIPTVTFCDMAKDPAAYFNKTVRLHAIFEQHSEGQYLTDEDARLVTMIRSASDTRRETPRVRTMFDAQGRKYRSQSTEVERKSP